VQPIREAVLGWRRLRNDVAVCHIATIWRQPVIRRISPPAGRGILRAIERSFPNVDVHALGLTLSELGGLLNPLFVCGGFIRQPELTTSTTYSQDVTKGNERD